jgi:hypothetical protein
MDTLIETQSASIDTLSVTIRALHVNGKQMTLAVFRQMPIREETPAAQLWGVVRYDIKDQGHLWLVFSDNGALYRRALNIQKRYPSNYEVYKAIKYLKEHQEKYGNPMTLESIEKHFSMYRQWDKEHNPERYERDLKACVDTARAERERLLATYNGEKAEYDACVKEEDIRWRYECQCAALTQLFIAV